MDVCELKYQRQIELEEEARAVAYAKGQAIIQDALDSGRYSELPVGRKLLAEAFNGCVADLEATLNARGAGLYAKYRGMLRRIPVETSVALGMRYLLSAVTHPVQSKARFQTILTELGKAIEAEAMVCSIEKAAPVYLERTLQYLDRSYTKSINHRYRTFLAAAEATMVEWEPWTPGERQGTSKVLMEVLFETGLFKWAEENIKKGMKHLRPSDALAEHLKEIQDHASPILRHDPMIVPPEPWQAFGAGGYLTPWLRVQSPMVSMRHLRRPEKDWMLKHLSPESTTVKAMNKAQSTAYRVNHASKRLLQAAIAVEEGCLGLPAHGTAERPVFPFQESWSKETASVEDLEQFKHWKRQVAEWHSESSRKHQTKRSIALGLQTLTKFQDEPELYFVTYLDYRGRVYFRGSVHPQSHDAIKACIELAHGAPLGERGLFWLKVQVASCAGFDKKDFPLRAAWTDENWQSICAWLDDPLATEPPEPDTAFTFYAAATALRDALACHDPTKYVCHIPIAMDATCSG